MTELLGLWPMMVSWGAVAVLGGAVSVYALRAWRRTGTPSMLLLSGGLVILSLATAFSWFGVYLWTENPLAASLDCSSLMAVGFGTIFFGLRSRLG
jgi:hypothetical protein